MKRMAVAVIGAWALTTPSIASAAILPSLDRATFQASVNGSTLILQNFDAFADGATLTDDGFVTYASSSGTPQITTAFLTSTSPNGLGTTTSGFFQAADSTTFTFDSPITAFAIDINTFADTAGAYDVMLNTGDQAFSIFETFPGVGTGEFIGFTSATPFTSVILTSNTGFAYTLDTLIYGEAAAVGGVPEPATWAMILLGFGAVGWAMRRRKRTELTFRRAA